MATEILSARAVTKDYDTGRGGTLRALRGVDLSLQHGEVLGLVGESGCGKSTLAKLLLGIEAPSGGVLLVEGKPISSFGRLERARLIQPVFQDPYSSLNPRVTVGGIIAAPLAVRGEGRASRTRRARAMLDRVGLPGHVLDAYPGQLSGGQRQRVAIARALISEPRILICDEPTSALDVSVQAQILNLLGELRRDFGLTMVLVSHNLAVVNHLADRVAVMYLGRLVEQAPTNELFAAPRHPYTRALLDSVLLPKAGAPLPDLELGTEFPSALSPPSGCAFHPRCVRRRQVCMETEPPEDTDAGQRWRCYFPVGGPPP